MKNPETARLVKKTFTLKFSEKQKERLGISESMIFGVVLKLLNRIPLEEFQKRSGKQNLSSIIHHHIRKISRRKVYSHLKEEYERNARMNYMSAPQLEEEQQIETLSTQTAAAIQRVAQTLPAKSAFSPEETGVTYAIIGKSFSGKTYFIVQELNKLTKEELGKYTAIFFFTESTSAKPLEKLTPAVKKKMIVMDRFCPTILRAVKRLNDGTSNKFKFFIIFDDIIDLRGNLLTKSILTLRNSNISTVISIQYEKLLNPAQRSSLHNIYLFNLRTESWEYMLKGYLLGNFKEKIPSLKDNPNDPKSKKKTPAQIAQALRECLDDYIIYYDQRRDELTVYHKMKKSEKGKRKNERPTSNSNSYYSRDSSPPPPRHRLYSEKL